LCFANVTESDHLSGKDFMVRDGDRAFFTLGDMSALMTNHSLRKPFFIDDDSDFFIEILVFFESCSCEFGKMMIQFFGHIYEEDVFVGMGEVFVIHKITEDF